MDGKWSVRVSWVLSRRTEKVGLEKVGQPLETVICGEKEVNKERKGEKERKLFSLCERSLPHFVLSQKAVLFQQNSFARLPLILVGKHNERSGGLTLDLNGLEPSQGGLDFRLHTELQPGDLLFRGFVELEGIKRSESMIVHWGGVRRELHLLFVIIFNDNVGLDDGYRLDLGAAGER